MGIIRLGGFDGLWEGAAARGPEFLSMSGWQRWRGVLPSAWRWAVSRGDSATSANRIFSFATWPSARRASYDKGGLIAMGWTLVSYWGAPFIGIVGVAILGPDLADTEQVMPLLAKALVPGWIAGIMIAGATAAMMSTADSQLLVATSTLIEDIYVRMFRPKTTPGRLVLLSRLATIAAGAVALALAFWALSGGALVYAMVDYAWSGLGSSFGPPLLFALWWKRTSRWGVLAGMIGGMTSTVIWKNVALLGDLLDIKAATFIISAILVVVVSLMVPDRRSPDAAAENSPG